MHCGTMLINMRRTALWHARRASGCASTSGVLGCGGGCGSGSARAYSKTSFSAQQCTLQNSLSPLNPQNAEVSHQQARMQASVPTDSLGYFRL